MKLQVLVFIFGSLLTSCSSMKGLVSQGEYKLNRASMNQAAKKSWKELDNYMLKQVREGQSLEKEKLAHILKPVYINDTTCIIGGQPFEDDSCKDLESTFIETVSELQKLNKIKSDDCYKNFKKYEFNYDLQVDTRKLAVLLEGRKVVKRCISIESKHSKIVARINSLKKSKNRAFGELDGVKELLYEINDSGMWYSGFQSNIEKQIAVLERNNKEAMKLKRTQLSNNKKYPKEYRQCTKLRGEIVKYNKVLKPFPEKIRRAKSSGSTKAMNEVLKEMDKIKYKFYKFNEKLDQSGCDRFYLKS